ncbi:MAG TPA: macrocin O-methyltransferase [Dehalococcoidia bacterium]|nr:macrocin O-methyltransferase [Dehalococcoidia bacterium]
MLKYVIYKLSLINAAFAFKSVYYGQLLSVYIRNLRPLSPGSFLDSLRTTRRIFRVRKYTAILPLRLSNLHRLCREIDISAVPGDVVECGVYNGGSASILASVCTRSPLERDIWLFDSFEGLPEPGTEDGIKSQGWKGWCHGDLEKVKTVFQKLHIPESRVRIVKGWFQDTFPSVQIPDIALLHIDADWYESVKLCLEKFYDSVRPGGFVIIDDYGHWEGSRKATDEFLEQRGIDIELVGVGYTCRYFQKPLDT